MLSFRAECGYATVHDVTDMSLEDRQVKILKDEIFVFIPSYFVLKAGPIEASRRALGSIELVGSVILCELILTHLIRICHTNDNGPIRYIEISSQRCLSAFFVY